MSIIIQSIHPDLKWSSLKENMSPSSVSLILLYSTLVSVNSMQCMSSKSPARQYFYHNGQVKNVTLLTSGTIESRFVGVCVFIFNLYTGWLVPYSGYSRKMFLVTISTCWPCLRMTAWTCWTGRGSSSSCPAVQTSCEWRIIIQTIIAILTIVAVMTIILLRWQKRLLSL